MLGEEYPDWDGGDEEAQDTRSHADLGGESCVGFAEAGEEGGSFVVGAGVGGVTVAGGVWV